MASLLLKILLLTALLAAEVYLLTIFDSEYFGLYVDVVVVLLFAISIYYLYNIVRHYKQQPVKRFTAPQDADNYEYTKEKLRRIEEDKLFKSKQFKEYCEKKQSREDRNEELAPEVKDIMDELAAKEDEIFDLKEQ